MSKSKELSYGLVGVSTYGLCEGSGVGSSSDFVRSKPPPAALCRDAATPGRVTKERSLLLL